MLGTLLATFNAPVSAFARVMHAINEQKKEGAPAVEETPAVEAKAEEAAPAEAAAPEAAPASEEKKEEPKTEE